MKLDKKNNPCQEQNGNIFLKGNQNKVESTKFFAKIMIISQDAELCLF